MTIVTTATTLEPVKRILRTVIALIIAAASVLPYLIGQTHFSSTTVTTVLAQLGVVATAITAFAATPAGQWLFGLVGLDATAVAKLTTDAGTAATDTVAAIATVTADGQSVIGDVKSTPATNQGA